MPDSTAELRPALVESLRSAISSLGFSQSRLLLAQVDRVQASAEPRWLPALTCLTLSKKLDLDGSRAMAAASLLGLLESMSALVQEVSEFEAPTSREHKGLTDEWGLALSLNAADGLFALAHEAVFRAGETGPLTSATGKLVGLLDECCTAWCEEARAQLAGESDGPIYPNAIERAAVELAAAAANLTGDDDAWLRSLFQLPARADSQPSDDAKPLSQATRAAVQRAAQEPR